MKKKLLAFCLTLLVSIVSCQLTVVPVSAASPPNPQPCKNPVGFKEDGKYDLVDNFIVDKDGKPPPELILNYHVSGTKDTGVDLPPRQFSFTVDFSKLQAVFGSSNSNYLEGNFQNEDHNQQKVVGLDSVGFNEYNRALQKITPRGLVDQQRTNYVNYIVGDGHTLPEAANKYTDINGQGDPKTIYDLVQKYGLPVPPTPSASQQDQDDWNNNWGKYWAKVPTAWSQFYKAKIEFRYAAGDEAFEKAKSGDSCPFPIENAFVNFVMPEFYRTTAISDQLNRSMVAKAAQSYQEHNILNPTPTPAPGGQVKNPLSEFFYYCWKLITSPASIAKDIQKTVSLNLPYLLDTLASPAYAQAAQTTSNICLLPLKDAKNGQAPYCPLPQDERARLGSAVNNCSDKNDSNKLEKDNQNVVCTFTFTFSGIHGKPLNIDINDKECHKTSGDNYDCDINVYIFPDFRIPWISAIWNNTLSSTGGVIPYNTNPNRPGVYSFFTPNSIGNNSQLMGSDDKKLPGDVTKTDTDPKQRFLGATDCAKHFVDAVSLKPIALQQTLGINQNCDLTSSAGSGSGGGITGPPPGSQPPNNNNCNHIYVLDNPLGNFGDPNCDFDTQKLKDQIMATDPENLSNWLAIIIDESGFNPNAYNPHAEDPAGAWGIFQMGRGKNGQLDHGDVNWELQIYNAINYNKTDNNKFCYWEQARKKGIAKNCT